MASNRQEVIVDYQVDGGNTEKSTSRMAKGFQDLAKKALVALSVAVGKAIYDFARFEKSLTNVYTLLGKDDLNKFGKKLEQGALDTMEKFGLGIEDTNKALFDTISAGVSAGDAIGVLDAAGKLAVGGVTNISTAVDGLTSVMNAYGKENFNATKTANVFFTAQKFGKTTVEALANSIGQVAPIAASAGMSFEETAAAMSTLTLAGLSTEEATTSVKAILNTIIAPASESAQAFTDMGIATQDANGNLRPFGDILADIETATGGNVQEIAKLFPNIRALGGASAFTGGKLKEYNQILNATKTDTESLDEAFKLQQATMTQQSKILGSTIQRLGIEFSARFAPALIEAQKGLISLLQAEGTKTFLAALGNIAGYLINAFVEFARVAGFVISGLWGLVAPLMPLVMWIGKAIFGFGKFLAGLVILFSPITWLIAALSLLGTAMSKGFDEARIAFNQMIISFLQRIQKIADVLNKLPGVNIDVKGAIDSLEKVNSELDKAKGERIASIKDEEQKTTEIKTEAAKERNAQLAEIEAENKAVQAELKAIEEEEEAAKKEAEMEAFRERLNQMSMAEIEAAGYTTAQVNAIRLQRERQQKEALKKMGTEYIGFVAKAAEEEKDIGKAVAIGTLEYIKDGLKKQILAKAAEITATGFGLIASSLGTNPMGYAHVAAGGVLAAGGVQAVNAIKLAEGGSMVVDRPTMIGNNVMAGEAGTERIDVTPMNEAEPVATYEIILQLDGETMARKVLKIGQAGRLDGFIDDGI